MPVSYTEIEAAALMKQHGITRVPADRYHYKTFLYSNFADAVAQAQRDGALLEVSKEITMAKSERKSS
jgi:hypothetical protein